MAWDSKSARRRQGSAAGDTARNLPIHSRRLSRPPLQAIQAKSAHVADPFLQDFLNPAFDAAEYLNAALPPLQATPITATAGASGPTSSLPPGLSSGSARSTTTTTTQAVPLSELSTQAQATLTQLNAHTTRLTSTLTQLTDDILRSGGRLAYEVELLRGETLSLAEALTDGLRDDVTRFVPGGLLSSPAGTATSAAGAKAGVPTIPPVPVSSSSAEKQEPGAETPAATSSARAVPGEPAYVSQLRTLSVVRGRLDAVIKTFGDAMEFVFPPSELSVSSSFLSVSAPDAGGDTHSTEEKGRQVLQRLRDEIAGLLDGSSSSGNSGNPDYDPIAGVEEAARRIEQLKDLATVWRGTAEEKGRAKFIDGLAKMVEDRHRELLREAEQASYRRDGGRSDPPAADPGIRRGGAATGSSADAEASSSAAESRGAYGGYGLISQLQKLRGGL